MTIKIRRSK